MRKLALLAGFAAMLALPGMAEERSKNQSYFTYDDGGTVVKQAGEDGQQLDAKLNLPVFPGDEVITGRRGRSEIRLSDGNIIALDRDTSIRFKSILDSYDGDAAQTVAELTYGYVMVHRTEYGSDELRLDTANASYVASTESVYSIETDSRGKDRLSVFDGSVEVRTPERTTRLRSGEEAHIDHDGIYGLVDLPRTGASEFERWFLRRSDRYNGSSRYLDRSLAYSDYDLQENGSWVYAGSYGGWAWRPSVSVGWRPYTYGSWVRSAYGSLVWVSDEPWGWVPYHYGRWASDPLYGWIWLPGYAYSPAWVYWMWGPSYVGWAPAGWYDCYRPYYDWCYRPYIRAGFGFGFFGHVRVRDIDLRPWTFVNPNTLFSRRSDRAALTTDAVRDRLTRGGETAAITGAGVRLSRDEFKDPSVAAASIARRGLGGGTGKEGPGSPTDMTSFFRRDPELSTAVRERIARTRGVEGGRSAVGSSTPSGSGGRVAPVIHREGMRREGGSSGSIESRGEGRIGRGSVDGNAPTPSRPDAGTVIRRGEAPAVERPEPTSASPSRSDWRDRVQRQNPSTAVPERPRAEAPSRNEGSTPDRIERQDWRSRAARPGSSSGLVDRGGSSSEAPAASPRSGDRGNAVPREIIDRIGGARVVPDERSRRDSAPSRVERSSTPPREERSSPPREQKSSPPAERSSPPPRNESHSSPPPQRSSSGEGHVQRDKH
jgi:hypothetical protein